VSEFPLHAGTLPAQSAVTLTGTLISIKPSNTQHYYLKDTQNKIIIKTTLFPNSKFIGSEK
jgi:hypothetical protein